MHKKSIPYGKQSITEADINAVVKVLQSDFLTQGPAIAEFEKKFATYIGAKYAVAVANGTGALHLGALSLAVNEQSRVITTPITFAASANCIKYCGGEIYFADIDPETLLLDINKVRALLEKHPKGFFKGIIPVDFAGLAVNMEAFKALADEYGCWLIEDACHAPGAYFVDSHNQMQKSGNGEFADLTVFSFHPVKHIATGEGGMITTNNKTLYEKLLLLRTHGISKEADKFLNSTEEIEQGGWYYEMQELGYNYRITDMQAALGVSQLSRADENLERRKEIARRYDTAFAGTSVKTVSAKEGNAYHLYIIQVNDRKGLYEHLRAHHIFAQVHYIPLHLMPYYKKLGFKRGDFPVAEAYYSQCLSIPMYPSLSNEEQDYVIKKILDYYQ